jgi:hypothetical protein
VLQRPLTPERISTTAAGETQTEWRLRFNIQVIVLACSSTRTSH